MKRGIQKFIKSFFVSGYLLPVMGFVLVVGVHLINKTGAFDEGEVEIITKSNLMEAIDVSELATSEFIYNGIAEVYADEKKEKVKYYIRYDARIRAGIDIKNVKFNIIKDEKIIEVALPEIEIFTPPSIASDSLSYIPSEKTYDLKEVLETCEADVLRESEAATELKISAKENLKVIIEALLNPIIEPEGYEIRWNKYTKGNINE
ncbi:MAG: DUF4230 domain-containing protein [Lachnospiraceae bacterium]|nr:DUF4230 domain-containing protein [Lachnospiraceae bacterium]